MLLRARNPTLEQCYFDTRGLAAGEHIKSMTRNFAFVLLSLSYKFRFFFYRVLSFDSNFLSKYIFAITLIKSIELSLIKKNNSIDCNIVRDFFS